MRHCVGSLGPTDCDHSMKTYQNISRLGGQLDNKWVRLQMSYTRKQSFKMGKLKHTKLTPLDFEVPKILRQTQTEQHKHCAPHPRNTSRFLVWTPQSVPASGIVTGVENRPPHRQSWRMLCYFIVLSYVATYRNVLTWFYCRLCTWDTHRHNLPEDILMLQYSAMGSQLYGLSS